MARKPRILADGCFYHIIQRGNNRRRVFEDKDDFIYFRKITKKYLLRYRCQIFHYCFLPNHIHMLIHAVRGVDMPKFLQGLHLSYSLYYKKRYKFVGSLWQGRYKSFLIDDNKYLLECARYIERNPVRAKIVEDISMYAYSSYNYYASGLKDDIITENIIYGDSGKDTAERQQNYKEYVGCDRFYEQLIDRALEICPSWT